MLRYCPDAEDHVGFMYGVQVYAVFLNNFSETRYCVILFPIKFCDDQY